MLCFLKNCDSVAGSRTPGSADSYTVSFILGAHEGKRHATLPNSCSMVSACSSPSSQLRSPPSSWLRTTVCQLRLGLGVQGVRTVHSDLFASRPPGVRAVGAVADQVTVHPAVVDSHFGRVRLTMWGYLCWFFKSLTALYTLTMHASGRQYATACAVAR